LTPIQLALCLGNDPNSRQIGPDELRAMVLAARAKQGING